MQQHEVIFTKMETELLVNRHEVAAYPVLRMNELSIALIL